MEGIREPYESVDAQHDLSRKERERLVRRQAMLEAASAVFADKGYANATLDEIAQRAEFGKGTIYNYFEGGKEEILFAVFDDLYDALCRLIDEKFNPDLVRKQPFRQVFEGFLTAIFVFFRQRQDLFLIMMKEGHRIGLHEQPDKVDYFLHQSERVIKSLTAPFEAAIEKGAVRQLPPQSIAHMVMGNVKGYHMHVCMEFCRSASSKSRAEGNGQNWSPPSPEESARFISTFLLDGLLERAGR